MCHGVEVLFQLLQQWFQMMTESGEGPFFDSFMDGDTSLGEALGAGMGSRGPQMEPAWPVPPVIGGGVGEQLELSGEGFDAMEEFLLQQGGVEGEVLAEELPIVGVVGVDEPDHGVVGRLEDGHAQELGDEPKVKVGGMEPAQGWGPLRKGRVGDAEEV